MVGPDSQHRWSKGNEIPQLPSDTLEDLWKMAADRPLQGLTVRLEETAPRRPRRVGLFLTILVLLVIAVIGAIIYLGR